jgi:steroid delta-isomerase-like uncharacterized protein
MMSVVERMMAMWNSRNATMADEIYSEDYCGVDVTDQTRIDGPKGVVSQLERFYRAFPDLVFRAEQAILEDDRVALYWSASGTHAGTLLNIPATGRPVQVNGISLLQLVNGKIARGVYLWDLAALLRAVGLLPELEKRAPLDPITLQDALTICT